MKNRTMIDIHQESIALAVGISTHPAVSHAPESKRIRRRRVRMMLRSLLILTAALLNRLAKTMDPPVQQPLKNDAVACRLS